MTLSGSSIPSDVTLSAESIKTLISNGRLFSIEGLDLYLIAGSQFRSFAEAVGRLRESMSEVGYRVDRVAGPSGGKREVLVAQKQP